MSGIGCCQGMLTNNRYKQAEFKLEFSAGLKTYANKYTQTVKNNFFKQ